MVYLRWKGKFCKANTTEQKFKLLPGGPHRQRSSQEPQNKQPDAVKSPLKNIVVSGFRMVDLEFLLFQLMKGCQNCQKNISLCDIEKETKRGLAYILYIKCNECKSLVKIYSSRYHTNAEVKSDESDEGRHNVFDISSLCAAGNCLCQVFLFFQQYRCTVKTIKFGSEI